MPTRMMIQATALMPSPSSCWARIRTAVAPMASVMPPAETRLPFRPVAGEFIRMSPMTKAPAPISQAMRTMTSTIPSVVTRLCLRLGDGLRRDRLLAEHLEHAVGDDVATDHVHRRESDRHQRKDLAREIVGVCRDQHPAHEHDAVDRVRAGHQRRVQRRWHLADDGEPDEDRQDEDRQRIDQGFDFRGHAAPPGPAAGAGSSSFLTASDRMAPPWVMTVDLVTSSSKSRLRAPSLTIPSSSAEMLRA